MTTSLHLSVVGSFQQILPGVLGQLDKAEAFCRDKGLPESALLTARLIDDMWPLARQVALTAVHSAGAIAAVREGVARPDKSDPLPDFASLRKAVEDAMAMLRGIDPGELDAIADRDMLFVASTRQLPFTVADYLLSFALPNFHFHATAAYAILRKEGVRVGKLDYLGNIRFKTD